MSKIDDTRAPASAEQNKAPEGPIEYAPMPIFLPVLFVIVLGFVIAYGVVSK